MFGGIHSLGGDTKLGYFALLPGSVDQLGGDTWDWLDRSRQDKQLEMNYRKELPSPSTSLTPNPHLVLKPMRLVNVTSVPPLELVQAHHVMTKLWKNRGCNKNKKTRTNTPKRVMSTQLATPRVIPPCSLCNLVGHATNSCPSQPKLHYIFSSNDL